MQPNTVFYQIMRPSAILQPNGDANYDVIGIAPDMGQAVAQIMARNISDAIIVLCVCLHVHKGAPPQIVPGGLDPKKVLPS